MKDLLYTVARAESGELIKAPDATKGERFLCVVCSGEMILRKSIRQLRRPHFAHKHLTQNCTPESALHFVFKTLLFNTISDNLGKKLPLDVEWDCVFCNEKHGGNLLKKVAAAKLEYDMTVCKPDIALLNSSDKPVVAMEIVVTHSPEDSSKQFYDNNNIILVHVILIDFFYCILVPSYNNRWLVNIEKQVGFIDIQIL